MDGVTQQDGVLDVVRRVWGFGSLRPLQAEAIDATLAGRDALVVLPTGGGKSLCYQVPPLVTGRLTLVISPLISLMKDQVDALTLAGYPAAALHSHCSAGETRQTFARIESGRLRLLLVAPERAMSGWFLQQLAPAVEQGARSGGVGAIAIDEAHCISHWGHDFRPEYRRLVELRRVFPGASMQAFTATATPRVRLDIIEQLGLRDPAVLVGRFDRPNLCYRVVGRGDLGVQVAEAIGRHKGEAAIVYCLSRKDTETLAGSLRGRGINAEAYHAGLDANVRGDVQERFSNERLDVVVATVAFGMGIDRSNVRLVAHATMPRSIEAYQQETGRAGRDGLPAECLLLYSPGDVGRWKRLFLRSAEEDDTDPAILKAKLALLDQMRRLCARPVCRHKQLTEHFGQDYDEPDCGACDVCLKELEPVEDATTIARKILSCVARLEQRFGSNHVIDVLRGRKNRHVTSRGHDRLSTFGLLREHPKAVLGAYIDQLIDMDVLERTGDDYPVLCFGSRGMAVMKGDEPITLALPARTKRTQRAEARQLQPDEEAVFQSLRVLRREIAHERNVPPFVVFSDATLRELAIVRPGSVESMRLVKGIGQAKLASFGVRFLNHIAGYCAEHELGLDAASGTGRQRTSRPADGTKAKAFAMFAEGMDIEAVAEATGRARSTSAGYLVEYVETRRPSSIDPWVDHETRERILDAARSLDTGRLKPIHDKLDEQVPYDQIRIVLAHCHYELT